jgi:hypothetical protein
MSAKPKIDLESRIGIGILHSIQPAWTRNDLYMRIQFTAHVLAQGDEDADDFAILAGAQMLLCLLRQNGAHGIVIDVQAMDAAFDCECCYAN